MERGGSSNRDTPDFVMEFKCVQNDFNTEHLTLRSNIKKMRESLEALRADIRDVRESIRAAKQEEGSHSAVEVLSIRERQVLKLIGEGNTTKEIGHILGIAFRTAVNHRTSIMAKLDIHNVAGLTRAAMEL